MSPTHLFFFLVGLCALTVHGRVAPPSLSELKGIAQNTLARHANEHQMRELESSHTSYSSLFEECGIGGNSSSSTASPSYSAEEYYGCACNCDAFTFDINSTSIFCSYQTLTEATTACYSSDTVTTCEDECSEVGWFESFDCTWAIYHTMLYAYGVCSSSDSLDSADDSGCVYQASGTFFFDDDTSMDTACEDYIDSAFPTSPVSLLSVFVVSALAVFGLQ
eukprot:CAMPEP_0206396844 /NCGR_PEP_ID=MMETSP0294-20121207/23050_1 /ASSEMBLY_ACC=CAM_ASM_000327 /TAXON_ID=39354 /ORGANISM="Heterosigma akashiwo, Strain CCMP2393" /LENGTH=220 /DNA_ID=CAMNT_0053851699 /DNA_START=63 /DNA_END=725 /DNA_ORIENTATION=+